MTIIHSTHPTYKLSPNLSPILSSLPSACPLPPIYHRPASCPSAGLPLAALSPTVPPPAISLPAAFLFAVPPTTSFSTHNRSTTSMFNGLASR